MRLFVFSAAPVLIFSCLSTLGAAELKVDAQGVLDLPRLKATAQIGLVIHDGQELVEFLQAKDDEAAVAEVCAALKIDQIDFDKKMLLVACPAPIAGETPARITILDVIKKDGTFQVRWTEVLFMLNKAEPAPARRACFALVDKSDSPVTFQNPGRSGR
jgi:hypothetical protein